MSNPSRLRFLLSPAGESGLTGAEAQAAMASTQAGATTDGYSVFTTGYLNRLSQSSNLILQAGNNITLDFQGDTLNVATGKSLTLTAGNQITTASTGTITTNNGAINLNATSGIVFGNAFTLNSNGGPINFNNATTLGADLTVNSGGGGVNFGSTVNGGHNLTINAGAGNVNIDDSIGGSTPLGALTVTSSGNTYLYNSITTNDAPITFNGSVLLQAGAIITSNGGNIEFASTVDRAHDLIVNAGNTGSATFTGEVGSNTPLGAFSVTAGNGITLNAVTATSINLNSSGGVGNIASNNSGILDATSGTITVNSGGDVDFSNIGMQTSNQAVSVTAAGNAYLNAINSGTGSLTVNANNVYLYGGGLPSPGNLVGYWNFNEGAGTTAIDDSGNGNNGTLTNGPTYSSSVPSALEGDPYSLTFNGTNSYVNVGSFPSEPKKGSSVSFWINPAANGHGTLYSNADVILYIGGAKNGTSGSSLQLSYQSDNKINVDGWNQNGGVSTTTAPLNTWTFVTITQTSSVATVYPSL